MLSCVFDSYDLGQGPVGDCCGCGNERSGSMKGGELLSPAE
jgi:hypothetical protein